MGVLSAIRNRVVSCRSNVEDLDDSQPLLVGGGVERCFDDCTVKTVL